VRIRIRISNFSVKGTSVSLYLRNVAKMWEKKKFERSILSEYSHFFPEKIKKFEETFF
jgi:HSP90 family molecular chaperone